MLDARLRVVKIAMHGANVYIFAFLRDHLQSLRFANAAVRVKHQHAGAFDIAKAFQRGLTRVARCGDEDIDLLGLARLAQRGAHQVRKHLKSYVFKRHGRPVPKLQHMLAIAQLDKRSHIRMIKALVSRGDHGRQFCGVRLRQICLHDAVRGC